MMPSPEELRTSYLAQTMPELEFFTKLLYCIRGHSVANIIGVLNREQQQDFRNYVMQFSELNDEADMMSVNCPWPELTLEEIRKFVEHYRIEDLRAQ